ncbi:MAG TPA: chlorophyll synthesis pathway protein BchC [Hyphomicrobium zavarzinii]|jgi:3-hydroxyethyl bacteriochlorophyllide a dehydrogenase|uniref:chlorophyll synthesis pathway protein BchC n=1 Tax=Hyphomicrobium sp. DMF-1 TaxID=3019544 RepID=UPI0022EBBE6A|nr:chlorophyll synthesis pathway protein BchC [Hyphomicrobium sp. DMF-1]WBT36991.1 chlorophyll synthesis pathway protein BchC [Hyphomicrobium sp. DMF-1]HML41537.1 chlorophyll synthesis pathway protein BchC [Hyphomicrobium zavarzinii]
MDSIAIVLEKPRQLALSHLRLRAPSDEDVVVDVEWSGISTGTERLLWSGRMPPFPGMGYPLVPGYETVGRVAAAGSASGHETGVRVFVPGARCFSDVNALFGGAASRLVVPGNRVVEIGDEIGEQGILLALAATAYHAIKGGSLPDLIVGHGVLGRLLARLTLALGGNPIVWETNPDRRTGSSGYQVEDPSSEPARRYSSVYDVSGSCSIIDKLIERLAPRGEIVLAGFYADPISFAFPGAFMKEARLRVAAEWQPDDLVAVKGLVETGRLSLASLITHRHQPEHAQAAYLTAFEDPACLKMILDWRTCQ